mmetsp:Transcript_4245/g.12114  ORF Transcript_4245/g.12114 Transcript_4245/m.12114 type:complete len:127 (-) Transcript_4245:986-1366(-)
MRARAAVGKGGVGAEGWRDDEAMDGEVQDGGGPAAGDSGEVVGPGCPQPADHTAASGGCGCSSLRCWTAWGGHAGHPPTGATRRRSESAMAGLRRVGVGSSGEPWGREMMPRALGFWYALNLSFDF